MDRQFLPVNLRPSTLDMIQDIINPFLVMSCQDFPGFKVEFGWILARDRLFRETDAYKQVKDLADTFDFDFKDSIMAKQDPTVCPKIILK